MRPQDRTNAIAGVRWLANHPGAILAHDGDPVEDDGLAGSQGGGGVVLIEGRGQIEIHVGQLRSLQPSGGADPAIDGQPAYNRAGPALPLTPGTRIGAYEITASLGAGGMGEVYRARDSKLKREVAIKVLPADVANDPERLARFQREAEVLASLNHPNIAHVYGFENPPDHLRQGFGGQEGGHLLVMELVEGEDLAERIARGPIPIDEALPIARQIAEALEAAHDAGIIHRDLKPANVKVRPDGTVKVLDFGLAKALDPGAGSRPAFAHEHGGELRRGLAEAAFGREGGEPGAGRDPANSPTITSPAMTRLRQGDGGQATQPGVILGTAAYMSPEQAKGKPVDKRADIWAFGCVLYEMLTGKRAFKGDDITEIITSVMRDTPDWQALPLETPSAIRTLLRRCIERDPRRRAPHMAIARMEIDDAMTSTGELVRSNAPGRSRTSRMVWLAVPVTVIALAIGWAYGRSTVADPPRPQPLRFQVDLPQALPFTQRATAFLAVSPDGTHLAYIAQPRGRQSAVWLHTFRDGVAQELEHTTGATAVFWSPDGNNLAFLTVDQLKRLDLSTGSVHTICECTGAWPGSWNENGVILIGGPNIASVPATGGKAEPVTVVDTAKGDLGHGRPSFLPDGRHFVFAAVNQDAEKSTLQLGELGSKTTRILGEISSGANYVEPGFLVYAHNSRLIARRFDAVNGDWNGAPITIADSVRQQALGSAAFSASPHGVIVYDATSLGQELELAWVGRDGQTQSIFATLAGGHTMALSPDDRTVAVEQASGLDNVVWLLDGQRGTRTRLTFENGSQGHPTWSPEGRRVAYFYGQPGTMTRLLVKVANGTRDAEPLLRPSDQTPPSYVTDWSRDGRLVVFDEQGQDTGWDIKYVDVTDTDRPVAVVIRTRYQERNGQLSPDGRLIAYESNETGQSEVYVATFPDASTRWPISNRGGAKPRWNYNGREIVFVNPDGALQSVAINLTGGFRAGVPTRMFELGAIHTDGFNYAVSRDGMRFLVMRPVAKAGAPKLSVIVNWPATVAR